MICEKLVRTLTCLSIFMLANAANSFGQSPAPSPSPTPIPFYKTVASRPFPDLDVGWTSLRQDAYGEQITPDDFRAGYNASGLSARPNGPLTISGAFRFSFPDSYEFFPAGMVSQMRVPDDINSSFSVSAPPLQPPATGEFSKGSRVLNSAVAPNGDVYSVGYYFGSVDLFGQSVTGEGVSGFLLQLSSTGAKKNLTLFPASAAGSIVGADVEVEPSSGAIAVALNISGTARIGNIDFTAPGSFPFYRSWSTKYFVLDPLGKVISEIAPASANEPFEDLYTCAGDCMIFDSPSSIMLLRGTRSIFNVRVEKWDLAGKLLNQFKLVQQGTDGLIKSVSFTSDASGNVYLSGLVKGKSGTTTVPNFIDGGAGSEFLIGLNSGLKPQWKKIFPWPSKLTSPQNAYFVPSPLSRVYFDRANNTLLYTCYSIGRRDFNPDAGVDMKGSDEVREVYLTAFSPSGTYLYSTPMMNLFSSRTADNTFPAFNGVSKTATWGGRYFSGVGEDFISTMDKVSSTGVPNQPDLAISGVMLVDRSQPNSVLNSTNILKFGKTYAVAIIVSNFGNVSSSASQLAVTRSYSALGTPVNIPVIKAKESISVQLNADWSVKERSDWNYFLGATITSPSAELSTVNNSVLFGFDAEY